MHKKKKELNRMRKEKKKRRRLLFLKLRISIGSVCVCAWVNEIEWKCKQKKNRNLELYTARSLYGRQFNRLQCGNSVDTRKQELSSAKNNERFNIPAHSILLSEIKASGCDWLCEKESLRSLEEKMREKDCLLTVLYPFNIKLYALKPLWPFFEDAGRIERCWRKEEEQKDEFILRANAKIGAQHIHLNTHARTFASTKRRIKKRRRNGKILMIHKIWLYTND